MKARVLKRWTAAIGVSLGPMNRDRLSAHERLSLLPPRGLTLTGLRSGPGAQIHRQIMALNLGRI